MKKLYQVNVKTEIQIPQNIDRDEFINLIGGKEENLRAEVNVLVSSENSDDAIIDGLMKYVEHAFNDVYDYSGIISRGDTRNRYEINISVKNGEDPIITKIFVELFPIDLGV